MGDSRQALGGSMWLGADACAGCDAQPNPTGPVLLMEDLQMNM